MEVEVVTKLQAEDGSNYTVEYEDGDTDYINFTKDGYGYDPFSFSKDDVDTLIAVLSTYRNGFVFPAAPDPTADKHSSFPE